MAIILDSSGLKLFGSGEWLAFKHRQGKRRKWLKLNVALDPKTQEVILAEITDGHESDASAGIRMIDRLPKTVKEVIADGAYETKQCGAAVQNRGARPLISPKLGAILTDDLHRDDAVRLIHGFGNDAVAKRLWKKLTGYGRRSLVETHFGRLKRCLGAGLRSRSNETRRLEVYLKLLIVNTFSRINSQSVAA